VWDVESGEMCTCLPGELVDGRQATRSSSHKPRGPGPLYHTISESSQM
jgi:hypothetical protein